MKGLFAVLLVMPVAAQAQVYGDTVGCQMLAGERPVSDSMFLYDGTTIQRMVSISNAKTHPAPQQNCVCVTRNEHSISSPSHRHRTHHF